MKSIINKHTITAAIITMFLITSCVKDLDTIPIDDKVLTSEKLYADFANYEKVLAKVYAGLAVSGQRGPEIGRAHV